MYDNKKEKLGRAAVRLFSMIIMLASVGVSLSFSAETSGELIFTPTYSADIPSVETEMTVEAVPASASEIRTEPSAEPEQDEPVEAAPAVEECAGVNEAPAAPVTEQAVEILPQQTSAPEQNQAEEASDEEAEPFIVPEEVKPTQPPLSPLPCNFISGSGEPLCYDWGNAVPESTAAGDEWFEDAAFVGNSLSVGLNLYGHMSSGSFFAATSISVFTIDVNQVYQIGDEEYITLLDALERGSYKKVYIMLGVNELYAANSTFHDRFGVIIDRIAASQPDAEIYIESIIPVSERRSMDGSSVTRENVLGFNAELKALAAEKQVYYVDVFAAFADENGYLPSDATEDGVHLKASYYDIWCNYLLTHTISRSGAENAT